MFEGLRNKLLGKTESSDDEFDVDEFRRDANKSEVEEIHRIVNAKNHFDVLECPPSEKVQDSESEEILQKLYTEKILKLNPGHIRHPQLTKAYQRVVKAYKVLHDPVERERHYYSKVATRPPPTQEARFIDLADLFNMAARGSDDNLFHIFMPSENDGSFEPMLARPRGNFIRMRRTPPDERRRDLPNRVLFQQRNRDNASVASSMVTQDTNGTRPRPPDNTLEGLLRTAFVLPGQAQRLGASPREQYSEELESLKQMGYTDENRLLRLLERYHGDLNAVLDHI